MGELRARDGVLTLDCDDGPAAPFSAGFAGRGAGDGCSMELLAGLEEVGGSDAKQFPISVSSDLAQRL